MSYILSHDVIIDSQFPKLVKRLISITVPGNHVPNTVLHNTPGYQSFKIKCNEIYQISSRSFSTYSHRLRETQSSPYPSSKSKESKNPNLNRASENSSDDVLDVSKYSTLRDDYQIPKYPIILCHGFSGFDKFVTLPTLEVSSFFTKGSQTPKEKIAKNADNGIELFEYWHGIKRELQNRGCTVLVAKVPPFAKIETRSKILNEFIETKIKERLPNNENNERVKVNLVAHSMGGLDCRYLISKLEQKNYEIMSLTTISTPHRGSYAADYALKNVPHSFANKFFPSISQLTLANCKLLNQEVTDDPRVKYYSYGSFYHPIPTNLFYLTWLIVNYKEGPNDGLVSLTSSKWGKYLGTLENVDHLDLINWVGTINRVKSLVGYKTFNPIALYLDIADNLAKEGL